MNIIVFKSDPSYLPLVVMLEVNHEGKKYMSGPIELMPEEWSEDKERELKSEFEKHVLLQAACR